MCYILIMKIKPLYQLRLITSAAMVGCVVAGSLLGWLDLPFDPRIGGVTLGAVWATLKLRVLC